MRFVRLPVEAKPVSSAHSARVRALAHCAVFPCIPSLNFSGFPPYPEQVPDHLLFGAGKNGSPLEGAQSQSSVCAL
jgi:hypothetical protein